MAPESTAPTSETCPACGTVIDTTSADPLVRVDCPKCGEKVRVQRSFNNFELVETLGIGGMGTVYKARDSLLDRFVALKLLRKDLGDEIDYATRLQQEARVAASVNHPNVIQVFSSGKDHGQFYLVMELVDKGSLDDLIEQKKNLPEELVLEAGIQVAKGLRAAYSKGLIHRDVKPANILFADDHTAKIGDFGLAGVAAETGEGRGEIWGTPYYVAPERLNNQPEDFRSDIYSLGATLFHALAGRAPIEGDTNSATQLRDLKNHPVDLRALAPTVSEETAEVFQRMIAPDPFDRFASYDDLVAALENSYGMLTGQEELLSHRRSKRPWIIGAVLLGIALIAVATWAYVVRQRSRTELSAVAEQAERMVAQAPLEGRMIEARRELALVHFNKANEAFARIATDARGKQPVYDWARFQQGLSSIIAREYTQATQAFQDVQNAGTSGFAKEDAELANYFVNTSKLMASANQIPGNTPLNPNNQEALSYFAYALKNISQKNFADAIVLLEKFEAAKPAGKFAWIADYKGLAQKYLADCRLYATWKKEADEAHDPAAMARHLERTHEITSKKMFQMYTALSGEVFATEKSLLHDIADQQRIDKENKEKEQKKQAEQTAKLVANKIPQWLTDWKAKLIQDLNTTHYNANIVAVSGAQYSAIIGATPDRLKVKLPFGEAEVPWTLLSPQSLLAVSASFARPNAPDLADREWLCAVYAVETGQAQEAKRLATAAAQAKPEYQAQLQPLLQTKPPGR
jgi:serine/threonine protein kinase